MSTTPLADPAAAATGTLPEPCVLLKLGEVVLKGGNRHQFERMLQANIRRAIADAGGEVRLWQRDGVIVIRVAQDSAAAATSGSPSPRPSSPPGSAPGSSRNTATRST